MKKHSDFLKDYVKRLNDDDIKYLGLRLSQRLGGDVAEATEFMQRHQDMDYWLSSGNSAGEFFDMIDQIDYFVQQEAKKRIVGNEQKEKKAF